MTTYTCWSCTRTVNPDDEPSPGEPNTCADCTLRRDREEQITRDWYADDPEVIAS